MYQVIEQTHEEKVNMYSKCSKLQLIEMLIQCNIALDECLAGNILDRIIIDRRKDLEKLCSDIILSGEGSFKITTG